MSPNSSLPQHSDSVSQVLTGNSVRLLKLELDRDGVRSKQRVSTGGRESGGHPFSRGVLYNLLSNPIYIGEIRHKGTSYPGQHRPIISRDVWKGPLRNCANAMSD
jgi:hypothetical protein